MAATQFSAMFNVQENVTALQHDLEKLVLKASNDSQAASQMFGVEKMSKPQRKQTLRKASLVRSAASGMIY